MVILNRINLEYSRKNIPLPTKDCFMKSLIAKTESFIKRVRWKVFFYENPSERTTSDENYGFRTTKTPPQNPALNEFENDLYDLISDLEFKTDKSDFQEQMAKDIKEIRNSGQVILPADKTTNLYKVSAEDYNKLLQDSITSDYRKAQDDTKSSIDKESATIASSLKLADRMQSYTTDTCFVSVKDHKQNFLSTPRCRLINPAKTDLGKVSKLILEKVVQNVNGSLDYNQWRKTKDVTDWFQGLIALNDTAMRFIQYDIESFYPSITESLLDRALDFAEEYCAISPADRNIIKQAKKSILFSDDSCWVKKTNSLFDITMGSYDGAESCEIVGLYLLHKISSILDTQFTGLYRDDGLIAVPKASGRKMDLIRKRLHKCFKDEGLNIVVQTNMVEVDFLDVTLNLSSGTFKPYRKPNDTPLYIHKNSNHPSSIKKNLVPMINNRLNMISSNETVFNESKTIYQEALQKSGHSQHLKWTGNDSTTQPRRSRRRRAIIWFNPPFSESVSTKIGKEFFKILEKHFPARHRLHKILNKNNVKLSYSCTPNIDSVIKSHNRKTLEKTEEKKTLTCNCRNKEQCPMDGQCRAKAVVYHATISDDIESFTYVGISEPEVKNRISKHNTSMNHREYEQDTELSKKFWEMKDQGRTPRLTWKILQFARPYQNGRLTCDLCLSEKLQIVKLKNENLLNKKTEFISKCRHKRKFLLERSL